MPALLLSKEKAPRGRGLEMLQLAPTAGLRSTGYRGGLECQDPTSRGRRERTRTNLENPATSSGAA